MNRLANFILCCCIASLCACEKQSVSLANAEVDTIFSRRNTSTINSTGGAPLQDVHWQSYIREKSYTAKGMEWLTCNTMYRSFPDPYFHLAQSLNNL